MYFSSGCHKSKQFYYLDKTKTDNSGRTTVIASSVVAGAFSLVVIIALVVKYKRQDREATFSPSVNIPLERNESSQTPVPNNEVKTLW